jgi:DNA processing protein
MTPSCDSCLRRAHLVALLAPRIAGLLDRRATRVPGLLGLPDGKLVAAAAPGKVGEAEAFLDRFDPEAARSATEDSGAVAVCRHADRYPPQLLALDDPPAVLFGIGRADTLAALCEEPAVAIVGTRRPSPYGRAVGRSLGRGLGASGVTVVSGLALGIDGLAHRGCLEGGGRPVAVLAAGPDQPYPRRHRDLYGRVVEAGIVLSEMPPGAPAYRWSFPARNRIMAGLARMTLVVEATQPSGSLITSDYAKDLGRAVAAVPGHITSSKAEGTNELIRDGAVPVTRTEDVLDELYGVGAREARDSGLPRPERPSTPKDDRLRAVLAAVGEGGGIGAIAAAARLSAAETRAALGRLEADGHVVRRALGGWEQVAG